MIWPHATPRNPCPICGKTDWCTFGEKAMLCQRVESAHPHSKGGWFHFYESAKPDYLPKPKAVPVRIDAERIMRDWAENTPAAALNASAASLGVSIDALMALGVAYAAPKRAWAFPMVDGTGKTVGIRLRNDDGFKWTVTGSRQGVFVPNIEPQRVAYLPEGPTDTAAFLTMGLFAIGRPNNVGGVEEIKATLSRLGIFRAVVVADNDELKQYLGREARPGIEGAMKFKRELGLSSVVWVPPTKDARKFLQSGGTREIIESDIKNRIWSKR